MLNMTWPFKPLSSSVALTSSRVVLDSTMPSEIITTYGVPMKTGELSLPSIIVMFMVVVVILADVPMRKCVCACERGWGAEWGKGMY